ncbi:MAG TPA: tetratricopeptide repeat protein, partial [Nitrospira sp.]|nr:tetratricopeptide repeat protein [Nitrospira sp.]
LAEAVRRIDERQFAGAEAILNQILTREPGNPQVCQLLARLHLQRGDVQVALGEYRFLAGAALRAHDLALAESLIQEFLSADPNSVPLLELNGELHEEKGNHGEAALQYAKAIELLLEHPEPGMESLHEELFEKVRSLSSDEVLLNRLAARIKRETSEEQSEFARIAKDNGSRQTRVESDAVDPAVAPPANIEESAAPPDYEAHYALGVAYKNMGLYEEAKEEFQVSMNSDSFYLDSALMTAVCLKEGRYIAQAIQGLEPVLADSRCRGAKAQAIRYELGLLYEAEEQWEKAVHAFESIPSFHDVPQRLAAIKGRQVEGEVGFRYAV